MKHYMHYQDGKWYKLVAVPRDSYCDLGCGDCAFYGNDSGLCKGEGYASNSCCDCGEGKFGFWQEIGKSIMFIDRYNAEDPMVLPKVILKYIQKIQFSHKMPIKSCQAIGGFCRRQNVYRQRIGRRTYYNLNHFFKLLWYDGYFETVINGDIEVEDE
ncbi:MAG: hypothetical protein IJS08_13785 [Victivallales bacterium]|nr:hypothetical protein [Victivallales bacterium]